MELYRWTEKIIGKLACQFDISPSVRPVSASGVNRRRGEGKRQGHGIVIGLRCNEVVVPETVHGIKTGRA